jgi:hypothetical protein
LFRAIEDALKKNNPAPTQIKPAPAPPGPEINRHPPEKLVSLPDTLPAYHLAHLNLKTNGRELHELPIQVLAGWVNEVVQVESPVHVQEVIRRIAEATQVSRIGPRLRMALEAAINQAIKDGSLRKKEEILWLTSMQVAPMRDRSQLPAAAKNIAFIAPEEIEQVIEKVVAAAFGMPATEIAPAVAKLLGFSRITDDIREQIDLTLEEMVRQKRLLKQQEQLVLADR